MKRKILSRQAVSDVCLDLQLPPVLQRIYQNRGISDVSELDYALKKLHPFTLLKDIDKAASYLQQAVAKQKRLLIVGDFDADGATSTALAVSALRAFGVKEVAFLVPNRFEYGYGLTPEIVAVAAKWSPDVIITVDNGISSCDGVAAARAKHIDVIVTDHHLPGETLPEAVAIVNPNQVGCDFPSKNLAGVGVIFYVMLALRRQLVTANWFADQQLEVPNMAQFLDLVALGTIADVVGLDHNNRILVQQGLRRIQAAQCRPGILALLKVAKREPANLNSQDLGFAIGPRLNAAGRLDDMALGIDCLLATDLAAADRMAAELNTLNKERQAIEATMKTEAMASLEKLSLSETEQMPLGLCLYDSAWHQGVIGILAGRIKERFHRPTIAFAKMNETEIKGSARSIPGVHIRDVLDTIATQNPALISKFGGHAMAAGLSLEADKLSAFAAAFTATLSQVMSEENCQGEIETDGSLTDTELTLELAECLRASGPWGQNFVEPSFVGEFELIEQRVVGENHLKMSLALANGSFVDAIAFNVDLNLWPNYQCTVIRVVYRVDVNVYRQRRKLQLVISYLEATD